MLESLKLSLLRILALVKKEFIAIWMDKGTRKILFVPVLVQSIIFGYGATFNLEHIPYVLCDNARSSESRTLIAHMAASGYFELQEEYPNLKALNAALDRGAGIIALYIPQSFTKDKKLLVLEDGRNSTSAATALGYLTELIGQENVELTGSADMISYRYHFNEQNITRYGVLVGMILALSMIQVLMLSAMTVARERENGTFDMLLMTPANSFEILLGKAAAPTAVAIAQGLMLTMICHFYFKITLQGSIFAVLAIIIIFSLCEVGVGLAVSAIAKSAQMALVCSFLIMLPSIILSGLLTPLEAMPKELIAIVKVIDPLYYGIDALQRVYLEGQSFWAAAHLLLPILGIGMAALYIAAFLFRKALQ